MALQFFDGLDDYGVANLSWFNTVYISTANLSYGAFGTVAGVFGGTAMGLVMGGNSGSAQWEFVRPLPTPVSSFIMGARALFQYSSSVGYGFCFSDTSNNVIVQVQLLQINGVSSVSVSRNGSHAPVFIGGTPLGSGPLILLSGVWYELEVELVVGAGTSGSVQVLVNGAVVLNLTGINTQGTAGATIGYAGPWMSGQNYNSSVYFDDIYGCDTIGSAPYNNFLSVVAGASGPRVYTLPPNANSSVAWTPSAGTNFSNVNSLAFQSSSNNAAPTVGLQDLFTIPTPLISVGQAVGSVLAVQTTLVVNENDAGVSTATSTINSGATNYQGASRTPVGTAYKYFDVYVNDPATSAPWAASKFNTAGSVLIGYKRAS